MVRKWLVALCRRTFLLCKAVGYIPDRIKDLDCGIG